MKRSKMTSMEDSNNYCGLCSEELYPQIIQCSCCEKNFHWECVGVDETIEEEEEWWLCDRCHSWINGSQETNSDSDNSGEFESTSSNRSKNTTLSESSGPSKDASSSRSSKTEGTSLSTSIWTRGTSARDQSEVEILSVKDRVTRCVTMEPEISLSIQRMASTTPSQSKSVLKAHPCPRDDANRHKFYGHKVRKSQESCQHLEQVGLSRKQTKPTESNKPKLTSKRRLSPAHDAKSPKFNGNEFNRDPECQAEIEDPKPKDNKSTVTTAYELPKQINWIQQQRNQIRSCMISQGKPTFSDSIRKIGKESKSKKYESRSFQKMENQLDITISSVDKWGPDNQRVQRSTFDEQIEKISLHGNQHEKIRVEVPRSPQTTRAPNQSTNDSRIPRQLSDRKHTFHQRQRMKFDKIENHKLKCENVLSEKSCRNENVLKDNDFKQGRSDICLEMEKGRLVFDIPRKSNVWQVPEHQEMRNCSSTLDETINLRNLESDRQKVENQRQGREFKQFEDQLPRYEMPGPVYTTYDQRMGFNIGKECIIELQGFSGPYQPHQYKEISPDFLKTTKYLDRLSRNVVSQPITLENPISSCARWGSEGHNLEIRPKIDAKPENPYHREYSQLVSQRVGEDPGNLVVNEWRQSNDRYGQPLNATRNSSIRRPRYISEWPQLVVKSVCSTSTCEYLANRLKSSLKCTTEFELFSSTIESLDHNRQSDSTYATKSNNRETARYDNPCAPIIWFGWLVRAPCYNFVVDRIEIDAEKLFTDKLNIHRPVWFRPPSGVIRYNKPVKLRTSVRLLNSDYQKWQWIPTRFESSNRCFVYLEEDHLVKAKFFCSSIAPKTIGTNLLVPPTTIGGWKSLKVDRWIIWAKVKTWWLKPQVIKWTKMTTFVLSNICRRLSFIPPVSQSMDENLKMPKRSARIVSNEQARRTRLWKPVHKSAVLDVIQQDDSLAQGLDRKTGGSVRITDSSTDPKFKRLALVTSILERHEQLNLNSRKWKKVNKQMAETSSF